MPPKQRRPGRSLIGAHVPVAGGLATGGLRYAAEVGAEAIQIFVSNPRGWALSAGQPREDAALRDHIAATGLPVFVHAPYLINLGSPDEPTRQRSVASLAHSLRRAGQIGARAVVVHTGSAVDGDRDAAMRHVREGMLPLLDAIGEGGPDLLLEPMAGQGHTLCAAVGDIPGYLANLGWHPRAGICLDTCHAFAAGHDLAAPGGAAAMLDELAATTSHAATGHSARDGQGRLRLIHANDSKDACGSRRDRHENIGAGQIGAPAFGALLHHPATDGVPFVVETPGPKAAISADLARLKRLRSRVPASALPAVR